MYKYSSGMHIQMADHFVTQLKIHMYAILDNRQQTSNDYRRTNLMHI